MSVGSKDRLTPGVVYAEGRPENFIITFVDKDGNIARVRGDYSLIESIKKTVEERHFQVENFWREFRKELANLNFEDLEPIINNPNSPMVEAYNKKTAIMRNELSLYENKLKRQARERGKQEFDF